MEMLLRPKALTCAVVILGLVAEVAVLGPGKHDKARDGENSDEASKPMLGPESTHESASATRITRPGDASTRRCERWPRWPRTSPPRAWSPPTTVRESADRFARPPRRRHRARSDAPGHGPQPFRYPAACGSRSDAPADLE